MTVLPAWQNTESFLSRECRVCRSLDCETQGIVRGLSLILKTEVLNDHVYRLLRTTLHTSGPLHLLSSQNSGSQTFISKQETDFSQESSPGRKIQRHWHWGFPNSPPSSAPSRRPKLQSVFKSLIISSQTQLKKVPTWKIETKTTTKPGGNRLCR